MSCPIGADHGLRARVRPAFSTVYPRGRVIQRIPAQNLVWQFPEPRNGSAINVTDLNKDGRLDVVRVTSGPQSEALWQVGIYLGARPLFECR